jgi:hypothetical protein
VIEYYNPAQRPYLEARQPAGERPNSGGHQASRYAIYFVPAAGSPPYGSAVDCYSGGTVAFPD